jgi:protein phosphatase
VDPKVSTADQPRVKFEACGRTDVGLKRPHNEDSIEISSELRLFAVADGMGGHAAGEVASRTALETLHEFIALTSTDRDFTWPFGIDQKFSIAENVLLTAIHLANRRVCNMAGENADFSGMGTTLVTVYMPASILHVAHVGDSRVYRLRQDRLESITSDHSWVNEQLQRKIITEDEARNHRWRNVITRALGNRLDLEVDIQSIAPQPGDFYLLCSDGLCGMIDDGQIHEILNGNLEDLQSACDRLIDAANQAGGLDNISVILIRILS